MTTDTNKKVFLTGGTGLIGTPATEALKNLGFEIYALTIEPRNSENNDGIHWIYGNLFDLEDIEEHIREIKPQYLLNLAWCATGDYITSELNYKFRDAGLELLKIFKKHGGRRAVYAGTCFEYLFKDEPLKETDELNPNLIYSSCKNELRTAAEKYAAENNISFGWGRIFYVYGQNEAPSRLTAKIIDSLQNKRTFTIQSSQLKKDYIYAKDIAGAFAEFLQSDVKGVVNICTGKAVSIGEFASEIATQLDKCEYLDLQTEESPYAATIQGDNTRLTKEIGYQIKYSLKNGIKEILACHL